MRSTNGSQIKRGFTLVELLVVIAIIGVLVALITPAIFRARITVERGRDVVDITGISTAMEAYRNEYGQYPPDFSGNQQQDLVELNKFLGRNFRSRDVAGDALIALNGSPADIDPAEALVVWLNGLSADPRRPLRGNNKTSLGGYELDTGRLGDFDNDGFPEYYPRGSQTPYVYYASSSGDETNSYDRVVNGVVAINQSGGIHGKAIPAPYGKVVNGRVVYANATKFQIISAGKDGQFVQPGYDAGVDLQTRKQGNVSPVMAVVVTPEEVSKVQEDNLSNFVEGSGPFVQN